MSGETVMSGSRITFDSSMILWNLSQCVPFMEFRFLNGNTLIFCYKISRTSFWTCNDEACPEQTTSHVANEIVLSADVKPIEYGLLGLPASVRPGQTKK
jgi:hypothetical protein